MPSPKYVANEFEASDTQAYVADGYSQAYAGFPSPIIGYMLDGWPIYGPYDANGDIVTGLDNCNGKVDDDLQGYKYCKLLLLSLSLACCQSFSYMMLLVYPPQLRG
jgi:hypothetical protein